MAAGLTVLYTILYIAPFYISPTLRSTTLSNRNNPTVIKARIRAVGLTCLLCTAINVLVFIKHGSTPQDILRLFGIYPVHLLDTARCILLVAILFAGPLFEAGIVEGYWRYWHSWSYIKDAVYDDWQGWRNIVIGPASEELVFRSLAIPLFLLAKVKLNLPFPSWSFTNALTAFPRVHNLCLPVDLRIGTFAPSS